MSQLDNTASLLAQLRTSFHSQSHSQSSSSSSSSSSQTNTAPHTTERRRTPPKEADRFILALAQEQLASHLDPSSTSKEGSKYRYQHQHQHQHHHGRHHQDQDEQGVQSQYAHPEDFSPPSERDVKFSIDAAEVPIPSIEREQEEIIRRRALSTREEKGGGMRERDEDAGKKRASWVRRAGLKRGSASALEGDEGGRSRPRF